MKSIKGFVLLCVLIYLQFFAGLSLMAFTRVQKRFETTETLLARNEQLHFAHSLLILLQDQIKNQACQIEQTQANTLKRLSTLEWEQRACSGNLNGMRYYYAI